MEDLNKTIIIMPNHAEAYQNRAFVYLKQGKKEQGCYDAKKACDLGSCKTLESAKRMGFCR